MLATSGDRNQNSHVETRARKLRGKSRGGIGEGALHIVLFSIASHCSFVSKV